MSQIKENKIFNKDNIVQDKFKKKNQNLVF